ncbi:MAG TPA: aminoglycoside phosphotransferase family protein [Phycisphaerae bacterium]|nr:aminoglycoside phosphotransferase family protein [Phycisphaerae bacterium]
MQSQVPISGLTKDQAQRLLAPVGPVSILEVSRAATSNDVFRVATEAHGTYYVKFHTARWYADQSDTFFVVERECAVCDFLRRRNMPLPFRAWGDFTRAIVPRSVFISEELPGIPVPDALVRFPEQRQNILRAFGRYMRQLHEMEFSIPGLFSYAHAYFGDTRPVPPVFTWDEGALHHPAHLQRDALQMLEKKSTMLPAAVVPRLTDMFRSLADAVRADYSPPRFTVGNCHAWHFHVDKANGAWAIQGFYDFEAVSAGDPNIDLVELEITLTPALQARSWRQPFFEGYGAWPSFDGHRRRLLYYLLCELGKPRSKVIPDTPWLYSQWPMLVEASNWPHLAWYPEREAGAAQPGAGTLR